jgi:rRNA maturation protein Nop10
MLVIAGSATAITYTMTGVNYCGEFLEFPDSVLAAIKAVSSSPMQMVMPSYRSYTNSAAITTAGTQVSFPIPAKFSSLKNIFVASRTSVGATGLYPMSHCKYGLTQYNFRVGSEVLPSSAPTTVPEFYNEALKCFGSIADLQLQPSADIISYQLNVPTTVTTLTEASTKDSGSFIIALDCEIYQATSTQSIFAGTNTNNSDIFLLASYTPAGDVTIFQTAFAAYDQVLVFENNVCYAKY